MKREKLKWSTIISYALAYGSGYQIMGSLVGAYLMIFFDRYIWSTGCSSRSDHSSRIDMGCCQ